MQLIFLWRSDCLGCAVLLCLVCLFDLLSSFLLISHLSCPCSLPPSTPPILTLCWWLPSSQWREQSLRRICRTRSTSSSTTSPPPTSRRRSLLPSQTHYILQCIMSIFISCAMYCCTRWRGEGGGLVERETHDIVHMAHHNTLY